MLSALWLVQIQVELDIVLRTAARYPTNGTIASSFQYFLAVEVQAGLGERKHDTHLYLPLFSIN